MQSLFKFNPIFDKTLATILDRDPKGKLCIIQVRVFPSLIPTPPFSFPDPSAPLFLDIAVRFKASGIFLTPGTLTRSDTLAGVRSLSIESEKSAALPLTGLCSSRDLPTKSFWCALPCERRPF